MDLACLNSYFLILVTRTVEITIPLDHEGKWINRMSLFYFRVQMINSL